MREEQETPSAMPCVCHRLLPCDRAPITAPRPQLRSAQDAAELLRQCLGAVDRKNAPIGINTVSIGALHKQHDIKQLECELSSPGVLEFSCTHRLIPASDGLETSKEEGELWFDLNHGGFPPDNMARLPSLRFQAM